MRRLCWVLAVSAAACAQTGMPSTVETANGVAVGVQTWGNYLQSMISAYLPAALPWAFTTLAIFASVGVAKVIINKL